MTDELQVFLLNQFGKLENYIGMAGGRLIRVSYVLILLAVIIIFNQIKIKKMLREMQAEKKNEEDKP